MKIGDFEILDTLGSGGSGIVYRARNETIGRIVALKQLNRQVQEGDRVFERFKREAQMMASVRSDHVVTLYLYQVIDGRPLLEMECLDYATLEQGMMAGPMEVAVALPVIGDILLGLTALHTAGGTGIVHRDIKPANVLQDEQGRFKITDFGLSVAETEIKTTFEAATIRYVAPECTSHPPTFDFRSDLYSVGMVAYEAILGASGFQAAFPEITPVSAFGDKWLRWLQDSSREATPLHVIRPDVPTPISMFVARLMAKDPERRFSSAGAALEALEPLLQVQPPAPRQVFERRQYSATPRESDSPSAATAAAPAAAAAGIPNVFEQGKKGSGLTKAAMAGISVAAAIGAVAFGAHLRKPPVKVAKPPDALTAAAPDNGQLTAHVVDPDGKALAGVTLKLLPGNIAGVSNGDGNVAFESMHSGHYEVTAAMDGYNVAIRGIDVRGREKTAETITLQPTSRAALPAPLARSPGLTILQAPGSKQLAGVSTINVTAAPQDAGTSSRARGAGPIARPSDPHPQQTDRAAVISVPQVVAGAQSDLSRALTTRVGDLLVARRVGVRGPVKVTLEMATRDAPFQGANAKTADWVATVRTPDLARDFEGHVLGFADNVLRNDVLDRAAAEITTALSVGATR